MPVGIPRLLRLLFMSVPASMFTMINFFKTTLARMQRILLVKFTMDVFARFGRDNGGLLAAGLAFFLVLALVPLLLVGLWGLGQ